jgi:hypothetical protein
VDVVDKEADLDADGILLHDINQGSQTEQAHSTSRWMLI